MQAKIQESADFLASRMKNPPEIGIITGTGLGTITQSMTVDFRLPYQQIPNFPKSTITGHKGTLVSGKMAGKPIFGMEGRFHLYEGYSPEEITFPIRVMARLGVKYLFISSAAGGLNPQFNTSDLMIVTDHINLTGTNPLIGPNLDDFGPRFPDMTQVYDNALLDIAKHKALSAGLLIHQGVYVGIVGPSLETPAETRFLRMIGADAVGMSTVLEVIVGRHCGMNIMVIAAITNINLPDCMEKTSIDEVIKAAEKAGIKIASLLEDIMGSLSTGK